MIKNTVIILFSIISAFMLNAEAQSQSVQINFQAKVGNESFDCKKSYEGIGTTNSKIQVTDFRFYVENVRLIDKKGKETLVNLTNDGKFQTEKVALLDFENGEGNCENGTKELNTVIRGNVPKGKYVGVKFNIGVPEELNHLDPTLQPSPLNISKLMWSWQMGYKFARIDLKTNGRPNGYFLHLGSTECETDANNQTICGKTNRPEFILDKFDLTKNVVTVDLKQLFADANVDVNQPQTASGCMSFEGDSDCLAVFKNLGLSFEGSLAIPQKFIRSEKSK